jgi:molybdenum cofactor cytidylyltransferase
MTPVISAVVLAAGASTRMGEPKLLLQLGGEPIIRRTVRAIAQSGVDDVLVVLGHEHERLLAALQGVACRHVVNREYATGMGSSFRAAVQHLPDSSAALFALADQPLLESRHYRQVVSEFTDRRSRAAGTGAIVCARYGEVTAPPHVFEREFFPELAGLEHGARPVLARHRERIVMVPLPPELLLDVDTPADYERARSLVSSGS